MIARQKFQKHIARQIKTLRLSSNLTQTEVAKKVLCVRSAVSQVENNQFMPTLYFAYKLALAFGVTIDEIMNFKIES